MEEQPAAQTPVKSENTANCDFIALPAEKVMIYLGIIYH
jgi:hypothetical protein